MNNNIKNVDSFNYLRIVLKKTGSHSEAIEPNMKRATEAMYNVFKRGRSLNLSIKCQYNLFSKLIVSILL